MEKYNAILAITNNFITSWEIERSNAIKELNELELLLTKKKFFKGKIIRKIDDLKRSITYLDKDITNGKTAYQNLEKDILVANPN